MTQADQQPFNERRKPRRRPYKSFVAELAWAIAVITIAFMLLGAILTGLPYVPERELERTKWQEAERRRQGTDAYERAKAAATERLARIEEAALQIKEKVNHLEGRLISLLDSEDGRYVAGSASAYRRFRELDVEPRYSGGRAQGIADNARRMVNDYPGHAVMSKLRPDDGFDKATRDMAPLLRELEVVGGDYDRLEGRLDLLIAEARRDNERHRLSLRDCLSMPFGGMRK